MNIDSISVNIFKIITSIRLMIEFEKMQEHEKTGTWPDELMGLSDPDDIEFMTYMLTYYNNTMLDNTVRWT